MDEEKRIWHGAGGKRSRKPKCGFNIGFAGEKTNL